MLIINTQLRALLDFESLNKQYVRRAAFHCSYLRSHFFHHIFPSNSDAFSFSTLPIFPTHSVWRKAAEYQ